MTARVRASEVKVSAQRRSQLHEAAHAVLAVVNGGTVHRVDLDVAARAGSSFTLDKSSRAWTITVLAGSVAEVLAGGRQAAFTTGGRGDLEDLLKAGVSAADAAACLQLAIDAVQQNWGTIILVADAIPVLGSLPGVRVHQIVAGAPSQAAAPEWPAAATEWFRAAYEAARPSVA